MSEKREQLVKTALKLFYRDGIKSTGIDKVLAESGVAKMTMYNHFKSKDDLIVAALNRQHEFFINMIEKEIDKNGNPSKKVLSIFDAVHDWINSPKYRGCFFINTVAEFGSSNEKIQEICREHKLVLYSRVENLLKEGGQSHVKKKAIQLGLLIEGAIVQSQLVGDADAAKNAKAVAKIILDTDT
jgi:AcrR family transcriptional regulator